MAHNLTETEGKVEFVAVGELGKNDAVWHKLGQRVSSTMESAQCIVEAGLNWSVEGVEALHETPNGMETIPNHKVIRREDTKKAFAIMSNKYQIIQNIEAFEFGDSLVQSGEALWDTAGSLDGGAKVFMQMLLPTKFRINSEQDTDTIEKRLLLTNSHDGSSTLIAIITPQRVVCQNTLNVALSNYTNMFKVRHTKNFKTKVEEGRRVLELASQYYDELETTLNQLAFQEVDKEYVNNFVSLLMPAKGDEVKTRLGNTRDKIVDLFQNGTGTFGHTKYDLFNAVTEYSDHYSNGRVTATALERSDAMADIQAEQRFQRAILGVGATLKQKAFDLLTAV